MIEIVKMTLAHVPEIARIERSCFSSPWSEASVASELENPLSLWLVAVESGKVAGYVGSQTVLGESDMMNLAVEETYRRQGCRACPGNCPVRNAEKEWRFQPHLGSALHQ